MLVLLLSACDGGSESVAPKDTGTTESVAPDADTGIATETDTGADSDSVGGDSESGDSDSATVDTCTTGNPAPPVPPPQRTCDATLPWIDVAAGIGMSCGVKSDGCAECWGSGRDDPTYDVPGVSFVTISMSNSTSGLYPHICGIEQDGALNCWGGRSGYDEGLTPAGSYVSIATGSIGGAAVREDGTLAGWGAQGRCAEGVWSSVVASDTDFAALAADGTLFVGFVPDYWIPAAGTWVKAAHASAEVCGIRSDLGGAIACVDDDDGADATTALGVPSGGEYIDVCVSYGDEVCALDTSGGPSCWDVLGNGNLLAPPPGPFVKITCGNEHACALTAEGSIECWGDDQGGETMPPS